MEAVFWSSKYAALQTEETWYLKKEKIASSSQVFDATTERNVAAVDSEVGNVA